MGIVLRKMTLKSSKLFMIRCSRLLEIAKRTCLGVVDFEYPAARFTATDTSIVIDFTETSFRNHITHFKLHFFGDAKSTRTEQPRKDGNQIPIHLPNNNSNTLLLTTPTNETFDVIIILFYHLRTC